jgi:uncharacterized membrane protein YqjE
MNEHPNRPLLANFRDELAALGGELREMVAARWELVRLELEADRQALRGLVLTWLAALLMALTALPVLVVCLAEMLDGWMNVPRSVWLLGFGLGLMAFALLGGYLAWRRFRRRMVGLRETLEELREDLVWLREKRK